MESLNSQLSEIESNILLLSNKKESEDIEISAKQDPQYEQYVNEGLKKIKEYYNLNVMSTGIPEWYRQYQNMTETQKETYAYLMGQKSGSEKADKYLSYISAEVNKK